MKPQVPIMNMIPESNRVNNCDIFNSVNKMSDLTYRGLTWRCTMKNETGKLVKNLRDIKFQNVKRQKNFNVEKVGRKNTLNWNHTNLILNWNQKYSDSIHVDTNHTELNSLIPYY